MSRRDRHQIVIDVREDTDQIVEDLPVERKYPFKSGVNIMFGCNNFCSYCIVPYVRGRERSRKPEEIIKEIRRLASEGVVEVMLLGQNVNSYGRNLETPMTFAGLLREVEKVDGIRRIRFKMCIRDRLLLVQDQDKDPEEALADAVNEAKQIYDLEYLK